MSRPIGRLRARTATGRSSKSTAAMRARSHGGVVFMFKWCVWRAAEVSRARPTNVNELRNEPVAPKANAHESDSFFPSGGDARRDLHLLARRRRHRRRRG